MTATPIHPATLTRVGDPDRPDIRGLRKVFRWWLKSDPQPTPGQLAEIRRHMLMGDRLADDVVAMYAARPAGEGRRLLDQALERGVSSLDEVPPALAALFAQLDHEPVWLDRDKLNLACDVSRRVGMAGELVLRNLSLMGGYLGGAAAKPLVFTGQLDRMAHGGWWRPANSGRTSPPVAGWSVTRKASRARYGCG